MVRIPYPPSLVASSCGFARSSIAALAPQGGAFMLAMTSKKIQGVPLVGSGDAILAFMTIQCGTILVTCEALSTLAENLLLKKPNHKKMTPKQSCSHM